MEDISGKVIIVTGASRGIGAGTARMLAQAGARVVLAALDAAALDAVSREITAGGGTCLSVVCDVRDKMDVQKVIGAALHEYGTIDGLVNNAGTIQPLAYVIDADVDLWKSCVETHLMGSLYFIKAVLPVMLTKRSGTIINVSSGAAELPLEGWGAYNTAKASLLMFSKVLWKELEGTGVRVFSLRPGGVDTKIQEEIRAANVNDSPAAMIPKENLTAPDYPASAIQYLFTKEAEELCGMELDVRHPPLNNRF